MSRFRRRTLSIFVMACTLAALGPTAEAGPSKKKPPAANDARADFDAGQKLFDQGKYAEALALFQKAYASSQSPNARLMIGRSLRALGRLSEAYDELIATKREAAAKAESEARYAQTRDAASAELSQVEPMIARLTVALAEPEGASVTINGAPLPSDKFGIPVAIMPGTVLVVATAPDGKKSERREELSAGQVKTLFLTFGAAPAKPELSPPSAASTAPSAAPPPASPPPEPTSSGGGVRVAGFAVAGLGVAGMALFGITGAMAQSKFDTLVLECGGVRCTDPSYADVVDSGKTMEMLSTVGLVTGIAGLVAGGAMIAFGGPKKAPTTGATVHFSPLGATVDLKGSF